MGRREKISQNSGTTPKSPALKSAFKDGTTHIVMSPAEFMQRLAALVPRPRLHLIRFHGVLAPNAKLRREIIPRPPEQATEPSCDHAQGAPPRMSWARLLKRVFDIDIEHCPNCGGALKIIAAKLISAGRTSSIRSFVDESQVRRWRRRNATIRCTSSRY